VRVAKGTRGVQRVPNTLQCEVGLIAPSVQYALKGVEQGSYGSCFRAVANRCSASPRFSRNSAVMTRVAHAYMLPGRSRNQASAASSARAKSPL
jgi:hypothetical protein